MQDQTSGELNGWLAYLRIDDEIQTQRTTLALLRAGAIQPAKPPVEDDEPVIDTTDPSFAEKFQGFINAPGERR